MNSSERLATIMRQPPPRVSERRALRLGTRDLLADWTWCTGCDRLLPPRALNEETGACVLCGGFDEPEPPERDWCEGRREVEAWLFRRGL